jgi:hypothetical protein
VYPYQWLEKLEETNRKKDCTGDQTTHRQEKEHGHFEKAHAHFPNRGGGFAYQPID